MSQITEIIRGNTVEFTVTFYDASKNLVVPSGATLSLSYRASSHVTTENVAMTSSGNTFVTSWECSAPDAGPVDWHISSDDDDPAAAQGRFQVRANRANPQS